MSKRPSRFHSLLHSADILEKRLATLLTPIGIKPRQARVLNMLARTGEVSQTVLTEQFDVTSGSMSTMIDRLLKLELIARRKNPEDRRGDLISLTPRGAQILEEVRDVWREIDEFIEELLGSERAALLTEITRDLKISLGGKVPGAGLRPDATHPMKRE